MQSVPGRSACPRGWPGRYRLPLWRSHLGMARIGCCSIDSGRSTTIAARRQWDRVQGWLALGLGRGSSGIAPIGTPRPRIRAAPLQRDDAGRRRRLTGQPFESQRRVTGPSHRPLSGRVTGPSHRAQSPRPVTGVRAGRGADEPSSEPAGSQWPVWREELDPETDGIAGELCVQPSQVNPGRVTAPSRRALVTPGRSRPAAAGRRGKLLRGAARAPAGQPNPRPARRRSRRSGWVWLRRWQPRRGTPARPPGGAGEHSGSGLPSRHRQDGGRPRA